MPPIITLNPYVLNPLARRVVLEQILPLPVPHNLNFSAELHNVEHLQPDDQRQLIDWYLPSDSGFISIIVSSLICFVFSQSHLTIYGVSVLSIVYINMLKPTYNHSQTCVITFLAGLLGLLSWRFLHGFGDLFHYFPGKIHAGMVLGVGMIVLTKFFPLTIENVRAFY